MTTLAPIEENTETEPKHTENSLVKGEGINNAAFGMRAINELEGFNFFVDSYQRGYKWTAQQVLDLLEDINDFKTEDGIYPLQPVVTKRLPPEVTKARDYYEPGTEVYELIDGQQRMTTIFIILSLSKQYNGFFSIEYATRKGSSAFLNSISAIASLDIKQPFLLGLDVLEGKINAGWQSYISRRPHEDNPDNYHFYVAWQIISLWFLDRTPTDTQAFYQKLLEFTQVIWYEINSTEVSEQVFMTINSGKVALTSAELIKALFLLSCKDDSNKEINDLRQAEIAHEWDRIETSLHNDEFWYFISNKNDTSDQGTRIDLLFDLKKVRKNNKDPFYSYRKYDQDWKKGTPLNWEEIKELYEKLLEWFENRDLFHLIGFIIYTRFSDIASILAISENKPKDTFVNELMNIIRVKLNSEIDGKKNYDLEEINYIQSPGEAKVILLLFNIESYLRSDSNFRFPFDRLKKQSWSLEHIHPQNPKDFTTNHELSIWAKDSINLLNDVIDAEPTGNIEQLKEKLKTLASLDNDSAISSLNMSDANALEEELSQFIEPHSLSNLALLDRITNSALGNRPFLTKRVKILEIDLNGWVDVNGKEEKAFIPLGTKNVFLKYYTKDVDQMSFWGFRDRTDYIDIINQLLEKYLI
jgi:hypothetical protein